MAESELAKKRRKVIWPEEVGRILDKAGGIQGNPFCHLLLTLCYNMALRVGELVQLRYEDFHRADGTVTIHTLKKGLGVTDELPVADGIFDLVSRYAARRGVKKGFIFPGRKSGTHISTRTAENIFDKAAELAHVDTSPPKGAPDGARGRGIHGLRHGRAIEMVDAGASEAVVAAQLRHGSARAVRWYWDTAKERAVLKAMGTTTGTRSQRKIHD